MVPAPSPLQAGIVGAELERARAAYRRSLEATRAQRAFSPSARHQDTACWSLLGALFVEPGMSRATLVGRIVAYAGVSRATAELSTAEGNWSARRSKLPSLRRQVKFQRWRGVAV